MARITEEQYRLKDLELKSRISKQLETLNYILMYKFGPYDIDMKNKVEEETKDGIKSINRKIWDEIKESQP